MTHEAFLHDIRLDPDDDGPRLIYADWLTDRGDHHGEFIRLQCQLDRLQAGDSQLTALQQRMHALLRQHRQDWLGFLGEGSDTSWQFRRGFLDEVCLDAAVFLDRARELSLLAPLLRHLRLCDSRPCLAELSASPQLGRLESLDLTANKIGDEGMQALAASPHLAQLHTLCLKSNEIGDEGAQALAASPHLARLAPFGFDSDKITEPPTTTSNWEETVRAIRDSILSCLVLTERVEVYILDPAYCATGPVDFPVGQRRTGMHGMKALEGEPMARLLALWSDVLRSEEGRQANCHYPIYGMRFFGGGSVLFTTSLCWGCNNYWAPYEDRGCWLGLPGGFPEPPPPPVARFRQELESLLPVPEALVKNPFQGREGNMGRGRGGGRRSRE